LKQTEITELEKLVISGLVSKPSLIYEYPEDLNSECFGSPGYRQLFQLITDFVYSESLPENELFVFLSSKAPTLTQMWLKLSSDLQPNYIYFGAAEKLINYRNRQVFSNLGKEIVNITESHDFKIDNLYEKVFSTFNSYNDRHINDVSDIQTLGSDLVTRLQSPSENLSVVKSGFNDLDKILNLDNGGLHVIAARPSMGKTALGFQMIYNASESIPVLAFSLEMSKEQCIARYIASLSGVPLWKIQKRVANKMEIDKIANKVNELPKSKLFIDDTPGQAIQSIQRKARQWKLKKGIGLILVDYLQLIHGDKDNREQEISFISRSLKQLARELDVPVIAISQLNRMVEMERDKRPKLSHIRESGSIEQDADSVSMLYRDDYYKTKDQDPDNLAEIIIRKQRNGATGTVMLQWEGEITTFRNFVKVEDNKVDFDKRSYYNTQKTFKDGPK